ncbi:MAG TPA: hypothetical protein VGX91_09040 [Candidatus Cybelea sp.]|nr:hypothetical protein [Candidatus Cybelea sp.]
MATLVELRLTLWIGAAALFAACAQSAVPNGRPAAGSSAIAAQGQRGSWMLADAKHGALLYLSGDRTTYVLSYPAGKLVGQLDVGGFSLCTDTGGNVFVSEYDDDEILEYAHGGTTPVATFLVPAHPWGCAVSPVNGDLAVALSDVPKLYHGEIEIFPRGTQGQPRTYSDSAIMYFFNCVYDDQGDLFVDGTPSQHTFFAEMPANAQSFTNIGVDGPVYQDSALAWDGAHVVFADGLRHVIDIMSIDGNAGKIASAVRLKDWHRSNGKEVWINGSTVIAMPGAHLGAAVWKYPGGGQPIRRLAYFLKRMQLFGVAVSRAQQ